MEIKNVKAATRNNSIDLRIYQSYDIATEGKNTLKLRLLSWHGEDEEKAKYDLRWWFMKDGEEKCGKGLSLTPESLIALADFMRREIADENNSIG